MKPYALEITITWLEQFEVATPEEARRRCVTRRQEITSNNDLGPGSPTVNVVLRDDVVKCPD